jgi:hypothetical protein
MYLAPLADAPSSGAAVGGGALTGGMPPMGTHLADGGHTW